MRIKNTSNIIKHNVASLIMTTKGKDLYTMGILRQQHDQNREIYQAKWNFGWRIALQTWGICISIDGSTGIEPTNLCQTLTFMVPCSILAKGSTMREAQLWGLEMASTSHQQNWSACMACIGTDKMYPTYGNSADKRTGTSPLSFQSKGHAQNHCEQDHCEHRKDTGNLPGNFSVFEWGNLLLPSHAQAHLRSQKDSHPIWSPTQMINHRDNHIWAACLPGCKITRYRLSQPP